MYIIQTCIYNVYVCTYMYMYMYVMYMCKYICHVHVCAIYPIVYCQIPIIMEYIHLQCTCTCTYIHVFHILPHSNYIHTCMHAYVYLRN